MLVDGRAPKFELKFLKTLCEIDVWRLKGILKAKMHFYRISD